MTVENISVFGLVVAWFAEQSTPIGDHRLVAVCVEMSGKTVAGSIALVTRLAVIPLGFDIPMLARKSCRSVLLVVGAFPGDIFGSLVRALLPVVLVPPCTAMLESEPSHVLQLLSSELNLVKASNNTLKKGVVSATTTIFVCVSGPNCIREPIVFGGIAHWPEDEVHSSFHGDHSSAKDRNMLCSRLGTPGQNALVDLNIAIILGIAKTFRFNRAAPMLQDAGATTIPGY